MIIHTSSSPLALFFYSSFIFLIPPVALLIRRLSRIWAVIIPIIINGIKRRRGGVAIGSFSLLLLLSPRRRRERKKERKNVVSFQIRRRRRRRRRECRSDSDGRQQRSASVGGVGSTHTHTHRLLRSFFFSFYTSTTFLGGAAKAIYN